MDSDGSDAGPDPFATIPDRRWERRSWGPSGGFLALALAAAIFLAVVALVVTFSSGPTRWLRPQEAQACPRPPWPSEGPPQFNEQQRAIRDLRRLGFKGDFFAQLELANRYEGRRTSDKNLQDPVEAAVWYAMALSNPDGYERTASRGLDRMFDRSSESLYDDCRQGERERAYRDLDRLLSQMSTDERDKVRNRATYVLSTQGAPGFRTLGRLHDVAFGPYGEPLDDRESSRALSGRGWQDAREGPSDRGWPDAAGLFERNSVDAYMYDYLALQTGDEGAYVLLQDLQHTAPGPGFSDIAETRARRWVPPYEFYPLDSPESGVPHSDESEPFGEPDRISQERIVELPFVHISEALVYLHVIAHPVDDPHDLSPHDAQTLQAMLGRPTTGWLTPLEKVRAVQLAAVNGSPRAQLVLAVMYAQGVGVAADYARAFHWFHEADRQGSPEAKFAIATYFSEGLAGVADQGKAQAVVHQLDAALSGFRPSIGRLRAMLERVSPGRRPWSGYGAPVDPGAPGYGDGGYPGGPAAGGYPPTSGYVPAGPAYATPDPYDASAVVARRPDDGAAPPRAADRDHRSNAHRAKVRHVTRRAADHRTPPVGPSARIAGPGASSGPANERGSR